jgi:HSP20 family protein
MAIIRWRPFADIDKFLEDVNLLQKQASRDLATDVYEEDGNIIVEMHMAGIEADKIDISVEGDHLRVSGTREEEKETEDRDYYAKEIKRGSFERLIHLPAAVDRAKTRAEVHEGVLKITLEKSNHEKGHKVKVESH